MTTAERGDYLDRVCAAHERERAAWFAARSAFIGAAARYLSMRGSYWRQIEGAGADAALREMRDDMRTMLDMIRFDVSSAMILEPERDYLTGAERPDRSEREERTS